MIGTISPLVKGARFQWWRSFPLHLLGSALGGAVLFGSLAYPGQFVLPHVPPWSRWAVVGVLALIVGLNEFGLVRVPLPRSHHSVPRSWWFEFGTDQAAFFYGVVLGVGITTIVPFSTFYLVGALVLLKGSVGYGVAIGTTYGVARAFPVLAVSAAMIVQRDRERAFGVAIEIAERLSGSRGSGLAHFLNGIVGAGLAVVATAVVLVKLW